MAISLTAVHGAGLNTVALSPRIETGAVEGRNWRRPRQPLLPIRFDVAQTCVRHRNRRKIAGRRVAEHGGRAIVEAGREPAATIIATTALMLLYTVGAFGFAVT